MGNNFSERGFPTKSKEVSREVFAYFWTCRQDIYNIYTQNRQSMKNSSSKV